MIFAFVLRFTLYVFAEPTAWLLDKISRISAINVGLIGTGIGIFIVFLQALDDYLKP